MFDCVCLGQDERRRDVFGWPQRTATLLWWPANICSPSTTLTPTVYKYLHIVASSSTTLTPTLSIYTQHIMSFRPPKCLKSKPRANKNKTSSRRSENPRPSHIIPVQDAPSIRLAPYTSHLGLPRTQSLFVMPGNRNYTQLPATRTVSPPIFSFDMPDESAAIDKDEAMSLFDITTEILESRATEPEALRRERARRKKEKQYTRWANTVIPSLLKPYMSLLRETDSLRHHTRTIHEVPCSCGGAEIRRLKVVCVYFERKFVSSPSLSCIANIHARPRTT